MRDRWMSVLAAAAVLTAVWAYGQEADPEAEAAMAAAGAPMVEEGGPTVTLSLWEPGLDVSASYHSNPYYRSDEDARAGMVFTLDPSLRVDVPVNELLYFGLDARIGLTAVIFTEDGEDSDTETVHPFVRAKVRYNVTEHTSASLVDDFQVARIEDDLSNPEFYLNNLKLILAQQFNEAIEGQVWYRNVYVAQSETSRLFDSVANEGGVGLDFLLGRMPSGRATCVGLEGMIGRKEFDSGEFFDTLAGSNRAQDNPKTHDYYRAELSLDYPLASLMTAHARAGWDHREYSTVSGMREEKSDSPRAGLTIEATPSPGSPLSFTLSSSYETTDTIVYNIQEYDLPVFEMTDALVNNLDIDYRELKVFRAGFAADYVPSRKVKFGLSTIYQKADADMEEDVGPISGNLDPAGTGVGRKTDYQEIIVAITARFNVTEKVALGIGYQHGFAEDNERDEKDVYEYDSLALLARVNFFHL